MGKTKTILTSIDGAVGTITLNRPELHHAMNMEMISELNQTFSGFGKDPGIRIILLRSTGEHFCAGADLNWMRGSMGLDEEQLKQEGIELASLFAKMRDLPKIILTAVSGKVIGGANGLVAASDLVIAEPTTRFAFSEVKLGLIPATIAPFVVYRVGRSRAAAWMISGRWFDAEEAASAGLVQFICERDELKKETATLLKELLSGGPEALRGIKQMMQSFDFTQDAEKIIDESAENMARFRISPEGQEGMQAFLEKRKPRWNEK